MKVMLIFFLKTPNENIAYKDFKKSQDEGIAKL
jgi:hypothetical protein